MKFYCGTDIIEVERIKNAIISTPSFKEKVYTPSEIEYAEKKNDVTKYECYAGRFAAKEAVYKSISDIFPHVSLNEIEIKNNKENLNRPFVVINNISFNELCTEQKISIDVSISHIKEYAIANATTLVN